MSLRNTFNTIQIDCSYPIHYIFTETRKEFFNLSLKKNLTNQNNRKMTKFKLPAHREEVEEFFNFMDRDYDGNLSFEVFCSWFFSGSILVTLGYLVCPFFNLFWRLVFRVIFYLRLLFFKLFSFTKL